MTLSEFKAWFEGFTKDMEGPPNAKQWKRIQARVKTIADARYRVVDVVAELRALGKADADSLRVT